MHHDARDLAVHLKRKCKGIKVPDLPTIAPVIPDGDQGLVRLAVRDSVPELVAWLSNLETATREWARKNSKGERKEKLALEDRTDLRSQQRVALYERIIKEHRKGESQSRRATRLRQDQDLSELARLVGFPKGISLNLVKSADQYKRDRNERQSKRQK
jgi:hypothetical protein